MLQVKALPQPPRQQAAATGQDAKEAAATAKLPIPPSRPSRLDAGVSTYK